MKTVTISSPYVCVHERHHMVASHIDTIGTKENTYIKGHSGFILTVYTVHAVYVECVKRS